ncbi:bifunctional proline dehydrogenase/L-glutamate gamma-semialdehyde dehydrogenase PutA [Afifella sp. IM 167]|uniref:bifunctional proline dehydrogenase/L-glutamate gamma-semialdehyde dehydrogenase PutA n=1 Tax=Afifella sp. IM 167 TaxID=2033586 RepID=UPI001CCD44E8|nr:bifunctional proline dehydrogenase/L-glutamate gamma-semialdehyde dehydrogenase PutA [Afifella sp. IM 167]MBZ8135141.1 bifunctional proline dehydrogenase/L-glutamate gamma-semialdehyde dehydrogenase [Afifella sp. IM 167]
MDQLSILDEGKTADEAALVARLREEAGFEAGTQRAISERATELVRRIREGARPGLMEVFLAEYGLASEEGIALMCLAEALLRVPDAPTQDRLIADKIVPTDWRKHLGRSPSRIVNAATRALLLVQAILREDEEEEGSLRPALRSLARPAIRLGARRAMQEMGRQFVLGETIEGALRRASRQEARGYTYSYDMLGEAALTARDAARYRQSYAAAIDAIGGHAAARDFRANPGISVKLSALHPRYEVAKSGRVMAELVPVLRDLARQAARARMNFTIDAEEADRLTLSLEVIEAVLADPELAGWDGFGVVVQAYGRRAGGAIEALYGLAESLDRRLAVRLVKGAYWDTEIKRAQVKGLDSFPVFTAKAATDVSYLANARKLLAMTGRIYPQFATHNAHTVAAVLDMAQGLPREAFELQRLHGMGERLHDIVLAEENVRCRIYAPVGAYRELLAYLVRRLLENGANSSFVNKLADEKVAPEAVVGCPFAELDRGAANAGRGIATGTSLFQPERRNSAGFDISHGPTLARIFAARDVAPPVEAAPLIAGSVTGGESEMSLDPATGAPVGRVTNASAADVETALAAARAFAASAAERAAILARAADLYEEEFGTFFALLAREAGKTLADAVGELREAVDFLRYYAAGAAALADPPRGVFACISPWNFPLAIFTGQVAAALAAGNGVIAKPAEQTPLIAAHAVRLLHRAGVPRDALQLLPGPGSVIGAAITSDVRIAGVAFTGSTETARLIRSAMAEHLAADAPLIAETGGLNAMLVDSTSLPEQAIRDIVASAFQSAGQRCSALRCLYVQEDVADDLIAMLEGAMDELALGDPWHLSNDVGPLIDHEAERDIAAYVETARHEGRLIRQIGAPEGGAFLGPALIRVGGIADLEREIFGPVLHVATYRASEIDAVVAAVNATGYGLTFGLHTRLNDRVGAVAGKVAAGNLYVNRNQIGAVVGSQPFGGEGLSGTGPKAGGPNYLRRFTRPDSPAPGIGWERPADLASLAAALVAAPRGRTISATEMPGPTGELNRLTLVARAPLLCLGPGEAASARQVEAVKALGGEAVAADGGVEPEALLGLAGFSGALWWGDEERAKAYARALARREGPILPLIRSLPDIAHVAHERHLCIDTTAAGGNTQLLAQAELAARPAEASPRRLPQAAGGLPQEAS